MFAIIFFKLLHEVFPFKNKSKNLDPSYETDLDLRDCFENEKARMIIKFHLWGHSREEKKLSHSRNLARYLLSLALFQSDIHENIWMSLGFPNRAQLFKASLA